MTSSVIGATRMDKQFFAGGSPNVVLVKLGSNAAKTAVNSLRFCHNASESQVHVIYMPVADVSLCCKTMELQTTIYPPFVPEKPLPFLNYSVLLPE